MPLGPKIGEAHVNKLAANMVGVVLMVLLCAAGIGLAHLLPNYTDRAEWPFYGFIVFLAVLVPVHEGLHAVGLLWFGGVSWADIQFGFMWRALVPYCRCLVPIPVRAFRRMALLPLVVTGTAALLCLLVFPSDWLGFVAGITVATCVGDVLVVAKLRPYAGDLLALDSPTEIGCDVFAP